MRYEEYLDKFCTNETFWKRTGDTYGIGLPLRIRFKMWMLKRKGYLVRVTLEYHHHAVYRGKVQNMKGYGFVRLYKYKPNKSIPIGLKIEDGNIGE